MPRRNHFSAPDARAPLSSSFHVGAARLASATHGRKRRGHLKSAHSWAVASVLALLALPLRGALGQTFTGAGATPNWSEAANWDTNQVPSSGTITIDLSAGEPTTV